MGDKSDPSVETLELEHEELRELYNHYTNASQEVGKRNRQMGRITLLLFAGLSSVLFAVKDAIVDLVKHPQPIVKSGNLIISSPITIAVTAILLILGLFGFLSKSARSSNVSPELIPEDASSFESKEEYLNSRNNAYREYLIKSSENLDDLRTVESIDILLICLGMILSVIISFAATSGEPISIYLLVAIAIGYFFVVLRALGELESELQSQKQYLMKIINRLGSN
ncbi:hypothetical protein [Halobacterium litoreum]|uniref:Uncharacterized protein n=1 Tax=Halobacterium litoreum TaxID=2039234 RepID=A0ABD5NI01_9EURY|nr:hypothetical protein [Halobacterium litoreum]UHH12412.1 hypothetical protein LT972_09605 [Halobacterium litoreum]